MTTALRTASPRGSAVATLLLVAAAGACAPAAASPVGSAPAPAGPGGASGAATPAEAVADTGVVRVSGSARVSVPSDRARITFAMETEAGSAAEAADANAARMNAVMEAVRTALGGAGTLETSGYGLDPVYQRPEPGGAQRIAGYRARNHVTATLTDVDRVGAILDAAVRAGANRVDELSFFASDTREARLEAIREATAQAREEAEVLAAALGETLGAVLEVSVSGGPAPRPMAFRAEMAMADTPVEAGSQEVSVTVSLTFRLGGR